MVNGLNSPIGSDILHAIFNNDRFVAWSTLTCSERSAKLNVNWSVAVFQIELNTLKLVLSHAWSESSEVPFYVCSLSVGFVLFDNSFLASPYNVWLHLDVRSINRFLYNLRIHFPFSQVYSSRCSRLLHQWQGRIHTKNSSRDEWSPVWLLWNLSI